MDRTPMNPSHDPYTRLMSRVRAGDDGAFERIFERYRPGLLRFSGRWVTDRDRAEELVQDAFLQVYRHRGRYEPKARLSTYLYRVMTNLCRNERRRARNQYRFQSLDQEMDTGLDDGGITPEIEDDRNPLPEDWVAGREMADQVNETLEEMPPRQAEALRLARMEGLPYGETARRIGRSVGAVKSLLFRGTRCLRERVLEERGGAS